MNHQGGDAPSRSRLVSYLRADTCACEPPQESLFGNVLTYGEIRRGIELLPSGKRRTQLEQWLEDVLVSFKARLLCQSRSRDPQSLGGILSYAPLGDRGEL